MPFSFRAYDHNNWFTSNVLKCQLFSYGNGFNSLTTFGALTQNTVVVFPKLSPLPAFFIDKCGLMELNNKNIHYTLWMSQKHEYVMNNDRKLNSGTFLEDKSITFLSQLKLCPFPPKGIVLKYKHNF